jgi:ribulose-phosphate 3-epimerase
MTVNPGFGYHHFLESTLLKIRRVAQIIKQIKPDCELGVDGGIDGTTAPMVVAVGANVLLAGTSVFGTDNGHGIVAKLGDTGSAVNQTRFSEEENLCNSE